MAEKNDAAKRIAYALDPGYKKISYNGVPVYRCRWNAGDAYVVPARGHLYKLKSDVGNLSFYPVLDLEWVPMDEDSYAKKAISVVNELIRRSDEIIIACDYDIEGETIGYNLVKYGGGFAKRVLRAKFSTLTSGELKESFSSLLQRDRWLMADAGRTRHYIDFIWGISLSRLIMDEVLRGTGSRMSLSIGRVQGPTLVEVYSRELEINSFVPRPYWKFKVIAEINGQDVELTGPNLYTAKEAEMAKGLKGTAGKVISFEKSTESVRPPYPFNLSDVQREAYRIYGIQPWETLEVLEKLYLMALISYPRTSSQRLPPSIGYRSILSKLARVYREAGATERDSPVQGTMTDPAHPAIYPTGEVQSLSGVHQKLYDLIVRRFIAAFYRDMKLAKKRIRISAGGFELEADGAMIVDKGWLEAYPFREVRERQLPDAKLGDTALIKEVSVELQYTKPPSRYTPSSLLEWMESNEIGTKATRAEIIKTLYKRGYIKGNRIELTELGFSVARYFSFSKIITLEMTRRMEKDLENIEYGTSDPGMVLRESVELLMKELSGARASEEIMELAKRHISQGTGESFGKCPACGKGELMLHISMGGKRYLKCSFCGVSAPLPRKGKLVPANRKCPYCGWPMIRRGDWMFCPNPQCPSSKIRNA
ncbi:MAG: DNA topoisomerase I [Nitrososphaeria archaeon]